MRRGIQKMKSGYSSPGGGTPDDMWHTKHYLNNEYEHKE
jgi:hypothetical protein